CGSCGSRRSRSCSCPDFHFDTAASPSAARQNEGLGWPGHSTPAGLIPFCRLDALERRQNDRLCVPDHGPLEPCRHMLTLEQLVALRHVLNDQVGGFFREAFRDVPDLILAIPAALMALPALALDPATTGSRRRAADGAFPFHASEQVIHPSPPFGQANQ